MRTVLYYVIFYCWFATSLLPFRILYFFSDLLYYPLYYLVRYRRKIVRKNLTNSFPEKNLSEIIQIEKEFYSFFCDYLFETIKLLSISEKEMRRRMKFEGMEEMNAYFREGRSGCLYLGHYCNWEWISSFPLHVEEGVVAGQVYHKLENKTFDDLFLHLRGRFQAVSIAMNDTFRKIVELRREGKTMVMGLIADQVPIWRSIHYWTDFLNQDTPVLTGSERIARQVNFVVFYGDVFRVKRGYYVCRLVRLSDAPKDLPEFQLTELYFRELEKTIRRDPPYWLWTHNRWKRTREGYLQFEERQREKSRRPKKTV